MVRVFANGPGDRGSIPDQVILKTQKVLLDAFLLNSLHYKVRIKGKWNNTGKRVISCRSRFRSANLQYIYNEKRNTNAKSLEEKCTTQLLQSGYKTH